MFLSKEKPLKRKTVGPNIYSSFLFRMGENNFFSKLSSVTIKLHVRT